MGRGPRDDAERPAHGPKRRLAAILVADVAGYARLVGADEEGTLSALKAHRRALIDPAIAAHNGRLVKTTGDGFLVEFASVVEALRCAIEWQQGMAERNAGLGEDRRLVFRIGINLGDVVVEDEDIHGDGVNVAARLEGVAVPGTICVSRAARDQVRDRFPMAFEDLGELRVKNMARPVRAFRVDPCRPSAAPPKPARRPRPPRRTRRIVFAMGAALLSVLAAWLFWFPPWPGMSAKSGLSLPDKPSIVVLPFAAIGDDSAGPRIGDGLTENIIASLSKIPQMFVIGRGSSFAYKGRTVGAQTVAHELGVRYVLEGSIQSFKSRDRISVHLIDAKTSRDLWGETYDRVPEDIFALEDELTLKVVTALQIELTQGELARIRQRGTRSLQAWLLVNQSLERFMRFTRADNAEARRLAEQALALDPRYPDAYVRLARTYLIDFQTGWVADRDEALDRSVELAQQALKLDPDYPDTYVLLGAIYLFLRQHDAALLATRKAVALSPNHSLAKASLGMVLTYAGEPEAAVVQLKQAMRLSPLYPDWFLGELGRAYFQEGRYRDAIDVLKQRLRRNPDSGEALVLLAAAASAAGRHDEARRALDRFLKPRPSYTLRTYASGEYYRNAKDLNRVLDALRKAGMKG